MKIENNTDCCCSGTSASNRYEPPDFIQGAKLTIQGTVPIVATDLTWKERLKHWRIRWGLGRMHYAIQPGLYAVGDPDPSSPVLVTANYKLTFDLLRKELSGLHVWILVLDSKGINVWCAAGKGTFGTEELLLRMSSVRLAERVSHRRLIVPQLGAPGIAAHAVQKRSGFHVVYGPIYSKDIAEFLANGEKTTSAMRRVRFSFKDRLTLVPMELIPSFKLAPFFLIWLAISWFCHAKASWNGILHSFILMMISLLCGSVVFQLVLPWLPTRSFALGGWLLGSVMVAIFSLLLKLPLLQLVANLFLLPPITAFLALNFTGATTFTSLSGVQKEMKYAIPLMIGSLAIGMVMNIIDWL